MSTFTPAVLGNDAGGDYDHDIINLNAVKPII